METREEGGSVSKFGVLEYILSRLVNVAYRKKLYENIGKFLIDMYC